MRQLLAFFIACCLFISSITLAEELEQKPRIIVLTDMGNEPDDQMSMVRLMLYSNELDIKALIASTSTWLRAEINPQTIQSIVKSYGEVRPNLLQHAAGWPEESRLLKVIYSGQTQYGMAAVGANKSSDGALAIIREVDKPDARPLWISVWGGANTLAQALYTVQQTRTAAQVVEFLSKLKIYSISDQDDAGPWIRKNFPALFYIVSPSSPDSGDYAYATWTGISGDEYYRNAAGAETKYVTNQWLEKNIRNKGPLSAHYLKYDFIMEGDTPAFLGLTQNGLASATNPSWGGWGGRYILRQPFAETQPIWTQGGDEFGRTTSKDTVVGNDGREYVSDQATIWRWRKDFQQDFAARMDWTVQPYDKANHQPIVSVNAIAGSAPIYLDVKANDMVVLDASASYDPDKGPLQYQWFYYPEAGYEAGGRIPLISIKNAKQAIATIIPSADCKPLWNSSSTQCTGARQAHIILAVRDNGQPNLTSYRRIILNITQ